MPRPSVRTADLVRAFRAKSRHSGRRLHAVRKARQSRLRAALRTQAQSPATRPIRFLAKNRSRLLEFTSRPSFKATSAAARSPSAFVLGRERQSKITRRRVLRRCPQNTRSPVGSTQRQSASPHRAPPHPPPFQSSRAKPHLPTHYVLPPVYFL